MRRLSEESGNVVVLTALMMTTLLGFLAITVDAGAMFVQHSSLQTGTDAAALAVAKGCAEAAVSGEGECTASIADGYLSGNAVDPGSVTVQKTLQSSWSGRAGRVTVEGSAPQQTPFAAVLGLADTQTVRATATARWGPLTAEDAVFPLAVCKGALPPVDQSFELIVDPAAPTYAGQCDGAPDEPAFGWLSPDDPDLCTNNITLLPSTYLDILPSDQEPTSLGCQLVFDELHNDIDSTAICHETPHEALHCHGSATSEDRQRDVVVYDASRGAPGGRPSYALVSIEFIGARFAGRASHSAGGWSEPCSTGASDPVTVDDLQCIRGIVRANIPETDGPIVDPELAALPGIEDTTVLDVRLVD